MNNQRTLGMIAVGAASAAIAAFFATGTMPDAPPDGVCVVSWAVGPCEAAVAFSNGDVVCDQGTNVTLPVEQVLVDTEGGGGALAPLDSAFIPIAHTSREIPCNTLTRPDKAMTVVPVEKHGTRVGTVMDMEGNVTVGTGPFCPPVVVAGMVPPGCE